MGVEIFVDYHPNEFSIKYDNWYANRDKVTTLLIGNSHIQTNINASILGQDAYNMAIGGSCMSQTVKMAETYLPQMERIKTVIVNFDYMSVYGATDNPIIDEKQLLKRRKSYENWEDYLNYVHHRYLKIDSSYSCYDFAICCNQLHFKTLIENNLTDLNLDKMNEDYTDNPYFRIERTSMKDLNIQVECIVSIAKLLPKRNAKLIVVTSPVHGKYLEQVDSRSVALMNTMMDSLSQIYSIEYKNYLFDTSFLHEKLFSDIHHLNKQGALLFSQKIKNDFSM